MKKKLLQGRNVMIRRYPGVGNLTVCRCPGVGNLALASIKMSNPPGFCEEGKTEVPGEKPLGAEKRTNKLNPHMAAGKRSRATLHCGKRKLSPLRHPCSQDFKSKTIRVSIARGSRSIFFLITHSRELSTTNVPQSPRRHKLSWNLLVHELVHLSLVSTERP